MRLRAPPPPPSIHPKPHPFRQFAGRTYPELHCNQALRAFKNNRRCCSSSKADVARAQANPHLDRGIGKRERASGCDDAAQRSPSKGYLAHPTARRRTTLKLCDDTRSSDTARRRRVIDQLLCGRHQPSPHSQSIHAQPRYDSSDTSYPHVDVVAEPTCLATACCTRSRTRYAIQIPVSMQRRDLLPRDATNNYHGREMLNRFKDKAYQSRHRNCLTISLPTMSQYALLRPQALRTTDTACRCLPVL